MALLPVTCTALPQACPSRVLHALMHAQVAEAERTMGAMQGELSRLRAAQGAQPPAHPGGAPGPVALPGPELGPALEAERAARREAQAAGVGSRRGAGGVCVWVNSVDGADKEHESSREVD